VPPKTPLPQSNVPKGKKQILHGLTGFAKPGQLMAIMGSSGSGKTSFLNVLGQRLGLSPGSKMTGEVRCNDRKMLNNDFGKLGAFV
jgi:ABC-type multidrug transport system ATPase subunit